MKIGFWAVDSKYPNLALMKIARYHKENGDSVEWVNIWQEYDIVYMAKVFTFTEDVQEYVNAKKIIKGGTGYNVNSHLPLEIERMQPDYSIYSQINNKTAYGFLTRGCPNKCAWCVVPKKEGAVKPYNDITDIATEGRTNIILMDNNILSLRDYAMEQLDKILSMNLHIDFNQGLDARLVDRHFAKRLAKIKWIKYIRFACDTQSQIGWVLNAITLLQRKGYKKPVFLYMLLTSDIEECLTRINFFRENFKDIVRPFCQPYRPLDKKDYKIPQWQKDLARYVNKKEIYNKVTFEDYMPRKNFKCSQYL